MFILELNSPARTGPAKEALKAKRIRSGKVLPIAPTARITFPSGRFADEVCPDKVAVIAWAANLATITFTHGQFARMT